MRKQILIVDDHVVVQTGVSIILEEAFPDFIIYTTDNYLDTIKLLSEKEIDLIILDINIPGGKNVEMVKEIKFVYPLIKILMFSVYNADTHACPYIIAGADGYLNKLSDKEQIITAVDSIFKNGSYLPSETLKNLIKISTSDSNAIDKLSRREKEITELLLEGEGNIEIATKLNINLTTVSTHKNKIFHKLNIKNIIELSNLFKKTPGINT